MGANEDARIVLVPVPLNKVDLNSENVERI